jgi:hypothetical protein
MYVVLHINFFLTVKNNNKMTALQFNARQFFLENYDLFMDSYIQGNSRFIHRILENELLFIKLCLYLKKGNLVDFLYMQQCFNESINDFKKDMQEYFA